MKSFVTIVFFTLFLCLSACNPMHTKVEGDSVNYAPANCVKAMSPCTLITQTGRYAIAVNVKKIITEQPFLIYVSYLGARHINNISGYLEGKTMYMGKIPLSFTLDNQHRFTAKTMLGMCTEQQMTWRIVLMVDLKNDGTSASKQLLQYEFQSSNH